MKKHSKKIKIISVIIVIAAFLTGCDDDKSRNDYVAKVNNSYLTGEEVAAMVDTSAGKKYFRNEVIKNWIEKELLYQAAVKEGITDEKEFQRLIENSRKELAVSLYIKKYLDEEIVRYSEKDIQAFFEENKNDFLLSADTYIINRVDFINEDKAILFRNTVLESDWNKALNIFSADSAFLKSNTGLKLYDYEIHPSELYSVIISLYPSEISILLSLNAGMFTIVQVENKFLKNQIPPLEIVKVEVEKRFIGIQKEKQFKELMQELYSQNDIDIKTR